MTVLGITGWTQVHRRGVRSESVEEGQYTAGRRCGVYHDGEENSRVVGQTSIPLRSALVLPDCGQSCSLGLHTAWFEIRVDTRAWKSPSSICCCSWPLKSLENGIIGFRKSVNFIIYSLCCHVGRILTVWLSYSDDFSAVTYVCMSVCIFISGSLAHKTNKQTDWQTDKSMHKLTTPQYLQILDYLIIAVCQSSSK